MGRAERHSYFASSVFGSLPGHSFPNPQSEEPWQVPDQQLAKAESRSDLPTRGAHQRPRQAGQSPNPAQSRGPGGANLLGGGKPRTRSRPQRERGPKAQVRAGTIKLAPFRWPASTSRPGISFWRVIVSRTGESVLVLSAPCPRRIGQRSGWIVPRRPKGDSGRLPAREFFRRICYSTIHWKLRLW